MDEMVRWPVLREVNKPTLRSIRLAHVFNNGRSALYADSEDNVFQVHSERPGKIAIQKLIQLCWKNVVAFETGGADDSLIHMAVTGDGYLYSWGFNDVGQFGNQNHESSNIPIFCDHFSHELVLEVKCGLYNTIFRTENEIWCSLPYTLPYTQKYLKISQIQNAVQIEIYNREEFAYLTEDGAVYVWSPKNVVPRVISFQGLKVKQIAMGCTHSLALTRDGQIFAWGNYFLGQFVNGTSWSSIGEHQAEPILQNHKRKFVEIASHTASYMSAAITATGVVYVWGNIGDKARKRPMKTAFKTLDSVFSVVGNPTRSLRNIINDSPGLVFLDAFDRQDDSDCQFRVGGETIFAHKLILMSASQYFRHMFSGQWQETDGSVVEVTSYDYPTYKEFIRYLYTGSIENELCAQAQLIQQAAGQMRSMPALSGAFFRLKNLVRLAHEAQEDALIEECVQTIRWFLNLNLVCSLYTLAEELKLGSLLEYCRRFATKKILAIQASQDFAKMDARQGYRFMCYAIGNEHADDSPDEEDESRTDFRVPEHIKNEEDGNYSNDSRTVPTTK